MDKEMPILLERQGPVAWLRMNQPERLNPLSLPLQQALREQFALLRQDPSVGCLVLTGSGKGFCVGADLGSLRPAPGISLGPYTADTMHALSNRLVQDLQEMPFPVVSAVNGACAGAGVGLALAADLVVAARSAYFYLPFMPRLGIVPDLGCTWFLQKALGRPRAQALALLGERLGAEQAQQWGLIWSCVDDDALDAQAQTLATRLAALPSHAGPEIRRILDHAQDHSLTEQMHFEAERQRELIDRPAFAEGVQAFLEKREPRFRA